MKKSSNDPLIGPSGEKQVKAWIAPSILGTIPNANFLGVPHEIDDPMRTLLVKKPVIKSGQIEETQFTSWLPVDFLPAYEQEDFPRAVNTRMGDAGLKLELDPREEQIQQLIRQAQKQAERKILLEQEMKIDSAREEAESLLRSAESILNEFKSLRETLISESEVTILGLVLDIGKALFSEGFELDQKILEQVILEAIQEAKELGMLTIYLHPEDRKLLDPHWPEGLLGSSSEVILRSDPDIERGGCFIDGELGQVDARVSTKLEAIRSTIEKVQTDAPDQAPEEKDLK